MALQRPGPAPCGGGALLGALLFALLAAPSGGLDTGIGRGRARGTGEPRLTAHRC